jgi:hypothetical protein
LMVEQSCWNLPVVLFLQSAKRCHRLCQSCFDLIDKKNKFVCLLLTVTVCFIFLSFRYLHMCSTIINLRGDEEVKVMQNCCKNL